MTEAPILLSEEFVQDCFHSYLKSALTQAKAERLLDTDVLSSAEGDLMITGPALCLYFAALRSTTSPPSVPLPRLSKGAAPPTDLSTANCPVAFRPFLNVWAQTVPSIQGLAPEHQHDLARIICNLPPVSRPPHPGLNAISADLRAVAIEVSMRRTFQDRYAQDLQAAIDAGFGRDGRSSVKASFVPPPVYAPTSPSSSTASLPASPARASSSLHSPSPSRSSFRAPSPQPPPVPPKILGPESPAIEFIRETLYAALADVLERQPALRRLLQRDPARAYFSAVALAILDVSVSSVPDDPSLTSPTIRGVLGKDLTLDECPPELRPFMQELYAIGRAAKEMVEDDDRVAIEALSTGKELPAPRMDRVREMLRGGVGWVYDAHHERGSRVSVNGLGQRRSSEEQEDEDRVVETRRRRTSTENRAVAFANRVNALSLGMTKLRAFRERQDMVFKVLAGVSS